MLCYGIRGGACRRRLGGVTRPLAPSVERWRDMGDKSPKNNQKQQQQKKVATTKKPSADAVKK